ncbi:MAG: hypothetical protein KC729_18300, partial [Candidatus Eisenbacteria bacterium]|nr:hypothetical protein [Candidatus Eisenbacteria bacterium]
MASARALGAHRDLGAHREPNGSLVTHAETNRPAWALVRKVALAVGRESIGGSIAFLAPEGFSLCCKRCR